MSQILSWCCVTRSPGKKLQPVVTRRSGITAVQTALVMVLIGTAVVAGVRSLGSLARGDMNDTAARIGDPTLLAGKFTKTSNLNGGGGSGGSGGGSGSSSGGSTGGSSSGSSGSSGDGGGSGGGDAGGGGLCP